MLQQLFYAFNSSFPPNNYCNYLAAIYSIRKIPRDITVLILTRDPLNKIVKSFFYSKRQLVW